MRVGAWPVEEGLSVGFATLVVEEALAVPPAREGEERGKRLRALEGEAVEERVVQVLGVALTLPLVEGKRASAAGRLGSQDAPGRTLPRQDAAGAGGSVRAPKIEQEGSGRENAPFAAAQQRSIRRARVCAGGDADLYLNIKHGRRRRQNAKKRCTPAYQHAFC